MILSTSPIWPSGSVVRSGLVAFALLLLTTGNADGQAFWQQTNLFGNHSLVNMMAANNGDLYVAAAGRVFHSSDRGASWKQLYIRTSIYTAGMAVDSSGRLIYAYDYSTIFRTPDGGTTWQRIRDSASSLSNDVRRIAVDSEGRIFVGTSSEGIYRSTDDGTTWTDLGLKYSDGIIYTLLIGHDDQIFATSTSKFLRSTDHGDTWSIIIDNGLPQSLLRSLALAPDGTLYAGGYGAGFGNRHGVYRSTDDGSTWSAANTGIEYLWVWQLAVDAQGGIIAAGDSGFFDGHSGPSSLHRSTDRGATWQRIDGGRFHVRAAALATASDGAIYFGTIDSVVKAPNEAIRNYSSSLWRSEDYGGSWKQINCGPATPGIRSLAVDTEGRVFAGLEYDAVSVSTDRGATWSREPYVGNRLVRAVLPLGNRLVLATSEGGGLLRSIDDGGSWSRVAGFPDTTTVSLARDSAGNVYVGTGSKGIYRSTDNGTTWSASTGPMGPGGRVAIIATSPDGVIYSGGSGNGMYRSFDNGSTWVWKPDTTFYQTEGRGIAFLPNGHVYMGVRHHLGRSIVRTSDQGESWFPVSGLTTKLLNTILFDRRGRLYAATDTGVVRSTDYGTTWESLNSGLGFDSTISSLAIDPVEGTLYAGSVGGIYRSSISTTATVQSRSGHRSATSPVIVQPNPSNGSTRIIYRIEERSRVRLAITDLQGRVIATPVDELQEAAEHSAMFVPPHLGTAVYFYRLNIGGTTSHGSIIIR